MCCGNEVLGVVVMSVGDWADCCACAVVVFERHLHCHRGNPHRWHSLSGSVSVIAASTFTAQWAIAAAELCAMFVLRIGTDEHYVGVDAAEPGCDVAI